MTSTTKCIQHNWKLRGRFLNDSIFHRATPRHPKRDQFSEKSPSSAFRGPPLVEKLRIYIKIILHSSQCQNGPCSRHPTAWVNGLLHLGRQASHFGLPCPAFFQNTTSFHEWGPPRLLKITENEHKQPPREKQDGTVAQMTLQKSLLADEALAEFSEFWTGWENA